MRLADRIVRAQLFGGRLPEPDKPARIVAVVVCSHFTVFDERGQAGAVGEIGCFLPRNNKKDAPQGLRGLTYAQLLVPGLKITRFTAGPRSKFHSVDFKELFLD